MAKCGNPHAVISVFSIIIQGVSHEVHEADGVELQTVHALIQITSHTPPMPWFEGFTLDRVRVNRATVFGGQAALENGM